MYTVSTELILGPVLILICCMTVIKGWVPRLLSPLVIWALVSTRCWVGKVASARSPALQFLGRNTSCGVEAAPAVKPASLNSSSLLMIQA